MSISKDLRIGSEGEEKVLALIEKCGGGGVIATGKFKDFDMACVLFYHHQFYTFSIEVKNDIYAIKSGNIAIEYFNSKSNCPSGINATKADIWAHIVGEKIYIAKTKELKDFTHNTSADRLINNGGDNNADLMLYKCKNILPIVFTRIDHLDIDKINKTIISMVDIE